jgi:regulator of sirC expression with transglutaminase-like and TPR domain
MQPLTSFEVLQALQHCQDAVFGCEGQVGVAGQVTQRIIQLHTLHRNQTHRHHHHQQQQQVDVKIIARSYMSHAFEGQVSVAGQLTQCIVQLHTVHRNQTDPEPAAAAAAAESQSHCLFGREGQVGVAGQVTQRIIQLNAVPAADVSSRHHAKTETQTGLGAPGAHTGWVTQCLHSTPDQCQPNYL